MKLPSLKLVLALAALASGPVLAMNNADILKMQQAGLSEDTILAAMQKESAEFDTSTDAIIELKKAGVSEKIIQRMLAPSSRSGGAGVTAGAAGAAAGGSAAVTAFYGDFPSIAPAVIQPATGKDYFTRYSLHAEKGEHSTTNYARGGLVPINTPVKLISLSGSRLILKRLDTGEEIKVINEEKFTKKTISEIASLMLAAEKTELEKLPPPVATAIRNGEMRKGMTKELVLMARGFPPAHETPSTESDRWVYWSSRFVKQTVVFTDGRLSEGRGLY